MELPASVDIIDHEQMITRGDETSLEAVQRGVGMSGGQPPGAPTVFATRGFAGNDVTLLYDGIKLTSPGMSTRPTDTWHLARIEILKGPASVLHGEGAVGGAINFVSKKPSRNRHESEFLVGYGSRHEQRIGLGAGGPLTDQLAYRFDASLQTADHDVDRVDHRYQQVSGMLTFDVSPQLTLTLEAQGLANDISPYFGTPVVNGDVPDRFTDKNYNVSDPKMSQLSNWQRSRLEWQINNDWQLTNLVYRYRADRHWRNAEVYSYDQANDTITADVLIEIEHDHRLVGDRLSASHESQWGQVKQTFLLGTEVSIQEFTHTNNSPYGGSRQLDPDQPEPWSFERARRHRTLPKRQTDQKKWAGFFENRLEWAEAWSVLLGGRHEQTSIESKQLNPNTELDGTPLEQIENPFTKTFKASSWRLGLVWSVNEDLSLYNSYTDAVSSPVTLVTLSQSARDVSLEEARQFEFGAKHQVTDHLSYTLSLYQITKRNLFTADPNQPQNQVQIGQQSSRGIELSLGWQPTETWQLMGNLAMLDAQFDEFHQTEGGELVSYGGNDPKNIPEFTANVWTDWQLSAAASLELGVQHVGERYGDAANRWVLDPYSLVDVAIAYNWSHYRWALRARNLTDETYIEWASWGDMALMGASRSYFVEVYGAF
jgi:iron complex outermembrane receptor protein